MKMKENQAYWWWLLVVMVVLLSGCGGEVTEEPLPEEEPPSEEEPVSQDDLPVFSLEELAAFDGTDGRPAYVAVDGLVYDFSELGRWQGGTHQGYQAGQDLTEALNESSPHGSRVLDRAPVVGILDPDS